MPITSLAASAARTQDAPGAFGPSPKPWRILFLANGLATDNGPDQSAGELALQLKEKGWQVAFATVYDPGDEAQSLRNAGIRVETLAITAARSRVRSIARLSHLLSDIRPHILHCHAPHAALAARAARLLKSVPIVISTQHARDMMDARGRGHWLRQFLTKATQAFGDVVTVPMQNGNANLTDLVIPSGVDLKRFSHNADVRHRTRKALQLGCSFTWLCASRFHPSKDHYTLLRAFAKANQQNPDSLLLLAGDGPGRSEVQELAQALCIADRVRFLGARTDVPALMNAADAYVLASLNETTPAVLLQAAASHLPIVATEVGGVPSIVHHGRTGFAVPPQNPEALASAMQSMMALPEAERRAIADSASLYVARYHDMEDVTATWERLYTQLLSRKRVQL